ncbi:hypothetical protein DFH28DRAFT_1188921 [Melampsora americana]|nr:hypothetical protein DFH28DRAFT_1188921 [Melampsora americana]
MFPLISDQPRSAMITMLECAASALFDHTSSSQPNPTQTQPTLLPNSAHSHQSQAVPNTNRSTSNQANSRSQLNYFVNNGIADLTTSNSPLTNFQPSQAPISKDVMLTMTSEELRCLAEKHSTPSISQAQMDKLIVFHETQQHELAMMALKIGVSVSAIKATWGKRLAVQMATADEANTLFKMYGGIANGQAMSELSGMWKYMSPEAKAAFKAPLPNVELNFANNVVSNKRACQIATPTSFQTSGMQVQTFLRDILTKYLATHNFQHRVATPGAQLAVELITETAGSNDYITGNSIKAIEAKKKWKGDNTKSMKKEVFSRLGRLIYNHWPWSDCDTALAAFGLCVTLRPGLKLNINVLKPPSAQPSGLDSQLINFELDQGGISLLPIEGSS